MRQAFAHQARLQLLAGGDERAPGAAVTVALCGHWEHEGPCEVPHRTDVAGPDDDLAVRVLFACEPADEADVRARVDRALGGGELPVPAPDGAPPTRWRLLHSAAAELSDGDSDVAARFVGAPRP
jgi:hypothetical protein